MSIGVALVVGFVAVHSIKHFASDSVAELVMTGKVATVAYSDEIEMVSAYVM